MQNLRTLRQRIRSVQNTQKITRAMQMVAGSKLRRMQGELASFRPYAERLEEICRRFLAAHPAFSHPLLAGIATPAFGGLAMTTTSGSEAPVGLVVVTSDTGLCGTYNERVLDMAQGFLREFPSAVAVSIGKKGSRFLTRHGLRPIREISDWGGRYVPQRSGELLAWLVGQVQQGKVSSWAAATTQFISVLRWRPQVVPLVPLTRPAEEPVPEKIIVEPALEPFAEELLQRTLSARFARILLEAFTAEHSARMIAMKNATDNADEMIDHLTLVRNKMRQAAITKELIEVVSGAEALK